MIENEMTSLVRTYPVKALSSIQISLKCYILLESCFMVMAWINDTKSGSFRMMGPMLRCSHQNNLKPDPDIASLNTIFQRLSFNLL